MYKADLSVSTTTRFVWYPHAANAKQSSVIAFRGVRSCGIHHGQIYWWVSIQSPLLLFCLPTTAIVHRELNNIRWSFNNFVIELFTLKFTMRDLKASLQFFGEDEWCGTYAWCSFNVISDGLPLKADLFCNCPETKLFNQICYNYDHIWQPFPIFWK